MKFIDTDYETELFEIEDKSKPDGNNQSSDDIAKFMQMTMSIHK